MSAIDMAQARLGRAGVAQEIGTIGKFIVECLERKPETLGVIYLRYQQWCHEKQAVSVPAFSEWFLRVVQRLIPESEIYSGRWWARTAATEAMGEAMGRCT